MSVSQARRIAFEILRSVEDRGAYAADLLNARLTDSVRREDAALATQLTLGVLRWRRLLDFLIGEYLGEPVTSLDLEVLLALRMGMYQLRWLTRVPSRAAVNESVEMVKWARKRSAAGLVNAILRKASSSLPTRSPARDETPDVPQETEELLPLGLATDERLGILYSHPTWMVSRWLKAFGEPRTAALLRANNRAPRVTCAVLDPEKRANAMAELESAGLSVEPGKLLRSACTVRGANLTETRAFRDGWISIQDEASQMVALLLDVKPGQSVLDLCAAPGGKAGSLARAAGPQALIVAGDVNLQRLRAMRSHLKRVGASHARLVVLDATAPLPFQAQFDRVLLDASCSGTGTLARNPEIRWRLRPEDLLDFNRRQVAMLATAVDHLPPGGRLVYSTCSLEQEENEEVVSKVLERQRDIQAVPVCKIAKALAVHLLPEGAEKLNADGARLFTSDGYFRTFPPEQHTDGFFAALLERRMG